MGASDVLSRLQDAGIRLYREGDRLIAEPGSRLTDELRAEVRGCRNNLLTEVLPPLGYSLADLEDFRRLILRATELDGIPPDGDLEALRRMAPVRVAGELREFRAYVASLEARAAEHDSRPAYPAILDRGRR